MKVARGELYLGRTLLIALMVITILPFISIFITALHPSGTVPRGLEWPANPQWTSLTFNVANDGAHGVEHLHCACRRSCGAGHFDDGGVYHRSSLFGSRILLFLFVFGLTLPFGGIIDPVLSGACHRHLWARHACRVGLYMPFPYSGCAHFVNAR